MLRFFGGGTRARWHGSGGQVSRGGSGVSLFCTASERFSYSADYPNVGLRVGLCTGGSSPLLVHGLGAATAQWRNGSSTREVQQGQELSDSVYLYIAIHPFTVSRVNGGSSELLAPRVCCESLDAWALAARGLMLARALQRARAQTPTENGLGPAACATTRAVGCTLPAGRRLRGCDQPPPTRLPFPLFRRDFIRAACVSV